MIKQKYKIRTIAIEFNCHERDVLAVAKRNNLTVKGARTKSSDEEIVEMIKQHKTIMEIMKLSGWDSSSRIREVARRNNVKGIWDLKHFAAQTDMKMPRGAIRETIKNGDWKDMSIKEIASSVGTTPGYVSVLLKEFNKECKRV